MDNTIRYIKSCRKAVSESQWDLVFEWEDQICESLHASLWNDSLYKMLYNSYIYKIPFYSTLAESTRKTLVFDMLVCKSHRANAQNIIPWIVDFYLNEDDLPNFDKLYRDYPLVLISCKDVCDFIEKNRNLCPNVNYKYLPLSLPDKYKITSDNKICKKYDAVLAGSRNPVLYEFMLNYAKTHPKFSYVDRKVENGHFAYYDNWGHFVGYGDTREDYFSLMKLGKVGLYATHWLDYKQEEHKCFYHMTPRFLEMLSCGMHVIARYQRNQDTDFFQISDFSPTIDTYADFEDRMDYCLSNDVNLEHYSQYLEQHYTSVRALQISELLKQK